MKTNTDLFSFVTNRVADFSKEKTTYTGKLKVDVKQYTESETIQSSYVQYYCSDISYKDFSDKIVIKVHRHHTIRIKNLNYEKPHVTPILFCQKEHLNTFDIKITYVPDINNPVEKDIIRLRCIGCKSITIDEGRYALLTIVIMK